MKKIIILTFALGLGLSACKTNTPSPDEQEPVAAFGWVGEQTAPARIIFANQSLNADQYHWDFGSGQTSDRKQPDEVVYDRAGSYEVLLRVSKGGRSALLTKRIGIAAAVEPVARFSYSFANRKTVAPTSLLLYNESINADTYVWEVNGAPYNMKTPPPIAISQPGDYKVKLTVVKGQNKTAVYEQVITVAANSGPVAHFQLAYHPYPYAVGEEIQFVNQSVNSDSWEWDFGNGGPLANTTEHPIVKFTKAGIFTISLVAKKGAARSAPATVNLKVGQ